MSTDDTAPAAPPPQGGPPPWIDAELQKRMEWRDGDIVVSVPAKSGTTWTMNIVHQLRSGGDPDFKDIYIEVPWLEFVEGPGQTQEQRLEKFRSMPTSRRRAFKTHASPPTLPFVEQSPQNPDVKYIVVARNPEEAIVSLKPFIEGHSQAFFDYWKAPKGDMVRPTFAQFYDDVLRKLEPALQFFQFVEAWWPLRNQPNVKIIHFSELKREPERVIPELAKFLGFSPREDEWPAILEYCSFNWMKKHQDKFELQHLLPVPVLDTGAMVRKGAVGAAKDDGMTDEIARDIRERGERIVTNPRVMKWFYEGGPLPQD